MAVANGEAAMINNGSWILAKLQGYNPDAEFGAFATPTEKLGDQMIMRPGSVQCVYNTQDETLLKYALELTEDLFTIESGTAFASGAMQISSVNGVDYSFSPCLQSAVDYDPEHKWSYGGFQRWNNEYEDLWANTVQAFALDGNTDADALCAELDAQFSTMK